MQMPEKAKLIGIVSLVFFVFAASVSLNSCQSIRIKKVTLKSPHNYAFQEDILVELNQAASVFVRYWKQGSSNKYRTKVSGNSKEHLIHLLLLETNTTYEYQIVIDQLFGQSSKTLSFTTREQSPWLKLDWVKEDRPHDASALGDGLIMMCYSRKPGYIALVDGAGDIRWYWQVDDIGVRAATITPRGTILALLRPPKKDVIDDMPKEQRDIIREIQKPQRRGKMGFAGGTAMVEIDLTGRELWRVDLDKMEGTELIHHDIHMDKNHNIHTLYRTKKPIDMKEIGGSGIDTLGGDGILVMDTTGKELWNWDVWDHWDLKNDPWIDRFAYDRFHMNALNFDTDSNYLVSVAIEDQVWKVNSKTGKIMWKFGKNGDFKMDTTAWFSFQHAIHINAKGDLMLFDNSLLRKESRALSFHIDTNNMTAFNEINAPLPKSKYTSRMGSAYLLPNDNLLQTSSKTGSVLVTTQEGEILWELVSAYIPYRAEYVPSELWDNYFIKE